MIIATNKHHVYQSTAKKIDLDKNLKKLFHSVKMYMCTLENPGIDPSTSCMLSERSGI